jgi:hypothetical protein
MDIITEVIRDGSDVIQAFAFAADKTFKESFLRTAKGAIKHVISITPPASASGVEGGLDTGSQAKVRGFNAIQRDLGNIFAPVKLRNKRKEAISASEMISIHRRMLATKRPGAAMRRDRAQPYYVDVRKFKQYLTGLRSHVGRLAAGWLPAAQAVGATAPAWISRHGNRGGSVQLVTEGTSLYVRAVNVPNAHAPAWVQPETQRRAGYAVTYALNDLKRQMPYLLAKDARKAGLSVG